MHFAGKEILTDQLFTHIPKHPATPIPKFHLGTCQLSDHRKCRGFTYVTYIPGVKNIHFSYCSGLIQGQR